MGYDNFSDFILALHEVDKDAAKFLATECIKKKEGMPSLLRDMWNPLHKWRGGLTFIIFGIRKRSLKAMRFGEPFKKI